MLKQILKNESYLNNILFSGFQYNKKLVFFYETINNPFLKADDFSLAFYKVIKVFNGLRKFVTIYRFIKAKLVVTTDLSLYELDPANKHVFCIKQQNNKYLFHINDLLHIIETSLSSSHLLFSTPQMIKNPYTNLPFDKSTLYNIYFQVTRVTSGTQGTNIRTELFENFFQSNLNIKLFGKSCEHILREYAIKDYVYKSDDIILREEILEMIGAMNSTFDDIIVIDKDFPIKILVKVMRPYLMLFLTIQCSLVPTKQIVARQTLYNKWRAFIDYNPQFGRKIIKIKMANFLCNQVQIIEFNTDSPRFINDHSNRFLKSHLF